jgi:predicted component of type VI protein secretion system
MLHAYTLESSWQEETDVGLRLSAINGPDEGKSFTCLEEIAIGRGPNCHVRAIRQAEVSRLHARIIRMGAEVWLLDLSKHGTMLNGHNMRGGSAVIEIGDQIDVGDTRFEVVAG